MFDPLQLLLDDVLGVAYKGCRLTDPEENNQVLLLLLIKILHIKNILR